MSIRIMEQTFNSTLKPVERLIMLCLADNANNEGVCFPSLNTIMKKSGLTRPTVVSNIKKLEEAGHILKKYRSRKKGGRSSNKYLLYPKENAQYLTEEDYELFEDLLTQSKAPLLPPQSKAPLLGEETQSKAPLLESEPSLKDSNRHLPQTPQNLNEVAFKNWCEYKGKSYTKQGKTLSANKLAKYSHNIQLEMVENSIMNNYAGLFEIKQQNKPANNTRNTIEKYFDDKQEVIDVGIN